MSGLSRRALLAAGGGLCALAALGRFGAAAAAAAAQEGPLALSPVAEGVWMTEGARAGFSRDNEGVIANCVVIETDAGAVVVDVGPSRRFGEALRAMVEQRFGGLAATFLTHQHPDHTFGAQAFADRPIIALPGTIAAMESGNQAYADALYALVGAAMSGTQPILPNTAATPGPMTIGGRDFEIYAFSGHTSADLALRDQSSGVFIAGDLLFLDRAPSFPDADVARWRESLDAIAALAPAIVVPGHGPVDRAGGALKQTRAYLDWFDGLMTEAAESGLSMIETLKIDPPARFAALGANPEEYRRSVAQMFRRYEAAALPRVA